MSSLPVHATEVFAAIVFAAALVHTFSTKFFEHLARIQPRHAGAWHLLGEVEVVFGVWASVLLVFMFVADGKQIAIDYMDSRVFTEPMFVFVVMVIAGSRPILYAVNRGVGLAARGISLPGSLGSYLVILTIVPLLGSLITEPAAMTLGALLLARQFFSHRLSSRLKYATLGVLFVNISIGGTLTSYAAPPVLMVTGKWGWDTSFMLATFGWKAAVAVFANAVGAALLFRRELSALQINSQEGAQTTVPVAVVLVHGAFLLGVVSFAHFPEFFMGLFLFFLGFAQAYKKHQDRLLLREGLLVAFFLAGLVVLGGQQQWWLQPLLLRMSSDWVFFGATFLTAITDNAALTYLGSLVDGLSDGFKYALVAGAVSGGGLTIIANAPNPAGISILRSYFEDETVRPLGLLLAAIAPTCIALLAFRCL